MNLLKLMFSLLAKRHIFPLILCFCYQTLFCQQNVIDSLETLFPNTTNIDEKIELYQALIVEYKEKDFSKAVDYSNEILKLVPLNAHELKGKTFNSLGLIYRGASQYDKAIACLDSATYYFDRAGIEAKKGTIDKDKRSIYHKLTVNNLYKDPNKAMGYAKILLGLVPNDSCSLKGKTYNLIAATHGIQHQIDLALQSLDSALYYLQKADNQSEIARTYNYIGGICKINNQYDKASKWLYKSLAVYDSLNLSSRTASTLDALASIDIYLKDYSKARKKLLRAVDIYIDVNNDLGLAVAYLNLGVAHNRSEEWKNALLYFDKAIPLFLSLENYGSLIRTYTLKSNALEKSGQLIFAQQTIEKAIELKAHVHNKTDLLEMYIYQAKLFLATQNHPKSIALFKMTLDSIKNSSEIFLKKEAVRGLMINYTATNNYKKAYEYSIQLSTLTDSITAQNNQKNIKDIEIKYNTEKKEQENKLLLKEQELQTKDLIRNRQLFYLSIGLAFLIFVISILVLKQYKTNATATNNELKSRLLRNQMSPHFLFNSLVAIQNFVYTNNPIKAGDYLSSFAALMRAILDNSSQEYITIAKELQWLENYLSLQLLRFKDKFEYQISLDEHIDVDNTLIPPMLIQPFIENAIEHGLKNLDKKGLISIRIQEQKNVLLIEVKDNGLGMSNNEFAKHKKHQSRALTITKERLTFLNKKLNKKINFDIQSGANDGTVISFQIPFKSKF